MSKYGAYGSAFGDTLLANNSYYIHLFAGDRVDLQSVRVCICLRERVCVCAYVCVCVCVYVCVLGAGGGSDAHISHVYFYEAFKHKYCHSRVSSSGSS